MKINGVKISQIIKHYCESNADFARVMEETPQTINNWIARGVGMSVLEKILEKYPEINLNWLLKNEGDMLSVKEIVRIVEKQDSEPDGFVRLTREEYDNLLRRRSSARVVVEFDVESDEFVKLGLKEKVVQVLTK